MLEIICEVGKAVPIRPGESSHVQGHLLVPPEPLNMFRQQAVNLCTNNLLKANDEFSLAVPERRFSRCLLSPKLGRGLMEQLIYISSFAVDRGQH